MRLNIRDYFMSSESPHKQQVKKTANIKCHINDDRLIGHFFIHQVHFIFIATL